MDFFLKIAAFIKKTGYVIKGKLFDAKETKENPVLSSGENIYPFRFLKFENFNQKKRKVKG